MILGSVIFSAIAPSHSIGRAMVLETYVRFVVLKPDEGSQRLQGLLQAVGEDRFSGSVRPSAPLHCD